MTNKNLRLASIVVTFPQDNDSADFGHTEYTADELERIETYGVVATATVFLKLNKSCYDTLELCSDIWGVMVFPEDRSYLGDCAIEKVRELRHALEALGVPLPDGDLPFYEVHERNDRKPLPLPCEVFA